MDTQEALNLNTSYVKVKRDTAGRTLKIVSGFKYISC